MTLEERIAERRTAEGGWRFLRVGAALVLASSALLAGNADTDNTGEPPSPLTASSTEGIGSLPMVVAPPDITTPYGEDPYGELIPGRLLGPDDQLRPFLVLAGIPSDVDAVVSSASGAGLISVVPGPSSQAGWIYGFHGDVEVGVDPVETPNREIEFGIRVADEFAGGLAVFTVNGASSPIFKLVDKTLSMPLSDLVQFIHQYDSAIEVHFLSPYGTKLHMLIRMEGGHLVVTQEVL